MSAFRRTIAILQPHSWLTLARESGSLQARDRQLSSGVKLRVIQFGILHGRDGFCNSVRKNCGEHSEIRIKLRIDVITPLHRTNITIHD